MLIFRLIIAIVILMPLVAQAQSVDSDGDGLSDQAETNIYYTDPNNIDSDGDGWDDGKEIAGGFSPRHGEGQRLIEVDSDNDYLNDKWEIALGTGLLNPDSDGDLYLDGTEVAASFDPLNSEPVQYEKLIKVDIASQRLSYYFGDKLFDSFLISGGVAGLETPEGEFNVLAKQAIKDYGGRDYWYPNTKWNLLFLTNKYRYWIHGAWWHDNFGQPMSHGCVNVSYDDMEALYWFAQLGTKVVID